MPIERRLLEQMLRDIGFVVSQRDHRVFELYFGGRRIVYTKTSRGTGYRTLHEPLVAEVARQLRIPREFLYELVRGTKTREDYLDELRKQGLLG